MGNKKKILKHVARKALRKAISGDVRYKGRSPLFHLKNATKYAIDNGPKPFVRRLKQEIVSIDKRHDTHLAFPNGLVTGVDLKHIDEYYAGQAKKVTIVIPSYNDQELIYDCIASIKRTTDDKYVKVIIVDDYCQSSSRSYLKQLEDEQVSVIYRKSNGGFAKAVNTGLKAVDKKHDVVLLNSDTVAHDGWLQALQYGAYEFGDNVGIVGPKLLYPDGRIQSAGSYRNTDVPEFFDHYYRFQDSNYGPANIPQYCIGVTGACMYIKREFLNNIGLLDEKFQFAFEDMDWCLRGWEAGYRSLYFPSATLTHVESASRPKHKTISEREKQSVAYFWEKWGSWFDDRNVTNKQGNKKVIFVLQTFGLSGGIKNIFELANRLNGLGLEVQIWGLDRNDPAWPVDDGLKIRTFKNYRSLTEALSGEEAIKVATWWETAFPVWLASIKNGIPVYFISEFETWFYPDDIVAQASVVSCYRKEFRNITISPFNLEELQSIGLNADIIPCGYDYELYKPLKDIQRKEDVLLAVGRTFFQKNFEMTYQAWDNVESNKPELWLYGFEPEIAKRNDGIKYHTKPSNEEVNTLYNKATAFMQTSRHEGFCLPVLEAMASGCPVITTDSHGNRGFCFDNKNCIIVEQDDIEGAAKAMDRLFQDKKLRTRLSKAALKTAAEYRWDVVAYKAKQYFESVK